MLALYETDDTPFVVNMKKCHSLCAESKKDPRFIFGRNFDKKDVWNRIKCFLKKILDLFLVEISIKKMSENKRFQPYFPLFSVEISIKKDVWGIVKNTRTHKSGRKIHLFSVKISMNKMSESLK